MQEDNFWADGLPWGVGSVGIFAIAYNGLHPERCPQAIAFASHAMFLEIMATRPDAERWQTVLYPDPTFTSFVCIGWAGPIATIEFPKLTRSN